MPHSVTTQIMNNTKRSGANDTLNSCADISEPATCLYRGESSRESSVPAPACQVLVAVAERLTA